MVSAIDPSAAPISSMTSAIVSVSSPAPPSSVGHGQAEEPELRELGQELQRELARLAPLLRVRHDAAAREVAHGVADRDLIVAVVELH